MMLAIRMGHVAAVVLISVMHGAYGDRSAVVQTRASLLAGRTWDSHEHHGRRVQSTPSYEDKVCQAPDDICKTDLDCCSSGSTICTAQDTAVVLGSVLSLGITGICADPEEISAEACRSMGEQCGGTDWTEATCCEDGLLCVKDSEDYSGCKLPSELRVWPVSNSSAPDLPQSSPFGPRLKASESYRYDFHRGIDIPTPVGTPLVAIDDGEVRLAGQYSFYQDMVVQVKHKNWVDACDTCAAGNGNHYSTYLHMDSVLVHPGDTVRKGQVVGLSGTTATFAHLHFEIRSGSVYQYATKNPYRYLPTEPETTEVIQLEAGTKPSAGDNQLIDVVVDVSVPPDQLTLNRVEIAFVGAEGDVLTQGDCVDCRFDFEAANEAQKVYDLMDNPVQGQIRILPHSFSSSSLKNEERCEYTFRFENWTIPAGSTQVHVTATTVKGTSKTVLIDLSVLVNLPLYTSFSP